MFDYRDSFRIAPQGNSNSLCIAGCHCRACRSPAAPRLCLLHFFDPLVTDRYPCDGRAFTLDEAATARRPLDTSTLGGAAMAVMSLAKVSRLDTSVGVVHALAQKRARRWRFLLVFSRRPLSHVGTTILAGLGAKGGQEQPI